MYKVIEEKLINYGTVDGERTAFVLVHIICDTVSGMPQPLPHWVAGSRCDVLENNGTVYLLSNARQWKQVNFYNQGEGGGFDPDNYYTKTETDYEITEKVAEIVADAPEDFDTLKEMSDWIDSHEDSAAAMNSAIQANTTAISGKVDKVSGKGLSTEDYTSAEKTKLAGIETGANNITVDSDLSSSSENPVQNKVINSALNSYLPKSRIIRLEHGLVPSTSQNVYYNWTSDLPSGWDASKVVVLRTEMWDGMTAKWVSKQHYQLVFYTEIATIFPEGSGLYEIITTIKKYENAIATYPDCKVRVTLLLLD